MPATGMTRRYSANAPAAAADAVQSVVVAEMKVGGSVSEVAVVPAATSAANATNYRTFTLYNRGAAGSGTTVVATMTTATVALTDNDERLMTLSATAADLVVAAGDVLEMVETVAAAGVAHSGYRIEVAVAATSA